MGNPLTLQDLEATAKKLGCNLSSNANNVLKAIHRNDGYCPCVKEDLREPGETYTCPCSLVSRHLEQQGRCCCNLFIK